LKTEINEIYGSWKTVKNCCRTTVNKDFTENEPSQKFKEDLLISEHSPIRIINILWVWKNIKYWVSTEWSRHKWEKFIGTQRTDRTGEDRDKKPQDSLVDFNGFANPQNLIDTERKRLCYQAADEARKLAEDLKYTIHKPEPEIANVLVPNCIYRCGCPEFKPCNFWEKFTETHKDINMLDIRERYAAYNDDFYKRLSKKEGE